MRLTRVAGALVVAVVLVACSDDGDDADRGAAEAPTTTTVDRGQAEAADALEAGGWCEEAAEQMHGWGARVIQSDLIDATTAADLHRQLDPDEPEPWSVRPPDDPVAECTIALDTPPDLQPDPQGLGDGLVHLLTNGTARTSLPDSRS